MFDPDEDVGLGALLREGDPALPLSPQRSRELKLDLLTRCEASLIEQPVVARPNGRRPRWLFWAGASAFGAATALLCLSVLNGSPGQPADRERVAHAPEPTPEDRPKQTPGGTAAIEPPSHAPLLAALPRDVVRPKVEMAKPAVVSLAERRLSSASITPGLDVSNPTVPRARERLVIDVADVAGASEDPPRYTSLSLAMTGSPETGVTSVQVIHSYVEEKTQ